MPSPYWLINMDVSFLLFPGKTAIVRRYTEGKHSAPSQYSGAARLHFNKLHPSTIFKGASSLTQNWPVCTYSQFDWKRIPNGRKLNDLTVSHVIYTYIYKYIHTYFMEQSPWETNWFVASHEFARVLLNPKVHYFIHSCSPPASILGQPNPVHTPTSYFLKTHPNIMPPPTPGSPQWSLSLRFLHKNPIHVWWLDQAPNQILEIVKRYWYVVRRSQGKAWWNAELHKYEVSLTLHSRRRNKQLWSRGCSVS
jgi:hypothetical protein